MQKTTQKTTRKTYKANKPIVVISPQYAIDNKMIHGVESTLASTILARWGEKLRDKILNNENAEIVLAQKQILLIGHQAKKTAGYHEKLTKILKTDFDIYKHLLNPSLRIIIHTKEQKCNRVSIAFETAASIKREFEALPLELKQLFPKQ